MNKPRPPWYRRDILPAWLPGWLAGSLLIGVGFAVMFGLFLDDPNPYLVAAKAGVCGFGLGIVIFSFTALRYRGPNPTRFLPPPTVRDPVIAVVAVLWPLEWVSDRRIARSPSRGGETIVAGEAAAFLGLTVLLLAAIGLAWMAVHRKGQQRLSTTLALCVVIAALAYATFLIARRHGG